MRCVGHCCRCFHLSQNETYDQIQDEYQAWLKNPDRDPQDEIQTIAPMIVPIGTNRAGIALFTCKHLVNRKNCSIYEKRPQMCREVGESIPCHHPYCGLRERTLLKKILLWLTEPRFDLRRLF